MTLALAASRDGRWRRVVTGRGWLRRSHVAPVAALAAGTVRPAALPGSAELPPAEREARSALERGDRDEALTLLMRTYGDALYRYCLQMMVDTDAADDVHQMTFVQAYEGFERFAGRSSLRVWLYGIARHRCLDALKTTRRRRRRFPPVERSPDAADPAPDPEDRVLDRRLGEELLACLGELPEKTREAVALRYQEGFSYRQMAELTGERPPTLQARVARALPVLRRCLEARGVSP